MASGDVKFTASFQFTKRDVDFAWAPEGASEGIDTVTENVSLSPNGPLISGEGVAGSSIKLQPSFALQFWSNDVSLGVTDYGTAYSNVQAHLPGLDLSKTYTLTITED